MSRTLTYGTENDSPAWLARTEGALHLLNAVLAVAHPELHQAGEQALNVLRTSGAHRKHRAYAKKWTSVYTGVSVICNRACPPHRDPGGREDWYDMLLTIGRYARGVLNMPDLGATFDYNPGTAVLLTSKCIRHAVPPVEGERVCYAWFMRDDVLERLGVGVTPWPRHQRYYRYVHQGWLATQNGW